MIYSERNGENMKNGEKQDDTHSHTKWEKKKIRNFLLRWKQATEKWTDKNESQSVSTSRVCVCVCGCVGLYKRGATAARGHVSTLWTPSTVQTQTRQQNIVRGILVHIAQNMRDGNVYLIKNLICLLNSMHCLPPILSRAHSPSRAPAAHFALNVKIVKMEIN